MNPVAPTKENFRVRIALAVALFVLTALLFSRALGHDPTAIAELACRFSGVVLPGETIAFKIRCGGPQLARFDAFVGDRKVLDAGTIVWRQS